MGLMLFQPGIGKAWTTPTDVGKGPTLKQLTPGTTLSALRKDYVAFTYAPLFLYGGLLHNPIQEWINQFGHTEVVVIVNLPQPILRLNPKFTTKLDSVIWAVEPKHWSSLAMHIGSIGLIDKANSKYTRAICQEIPIADVAAFRNGVVPQVKIYTFGVDSNTDCIVFEPAKTIKDLPTLHRRPPLPETVKEGESLFTEMYKT